MANSFHFYWRGSGVRRRVLLLTPFCVLTLLITACSPTASVTMRQQPYITSPSPLRIVSANDGDALSSVWGAGEALPDSLTVIDLSPDAPPKTRTVSGTVPNSYSGAPISAIVAKGRYAFVPNHPFGLNPSADEVSSQIAVVDLDATDLPIVAKFPLPDHAWQVMAHPDDERVIGISDHQFHVFRITSGRPELVSESEPFGLKLTSFAISPDGRSILATAAERIEFSTPVELHLFKLEGDSVRHAEQIGIDPAVGQIDQPFAPRFSPDGTRALVLNGLGISAKPPLDALLSIDMTLSPARVTDMIPDVAQGLESLTFHPSGRFAVVTCIDGPYVGHLAVVDLTSPAMHILSYLPIEFVTQGIEFSPDGSMLFVQSMTASHISVYAVEGMKLVKSPYVLRTGEGPASMAVAQ